MEPTFQTTFIPKKPVAPVATETKPAGAVTFFGIIATLVFLASIVSYGIFYIYKKQISASIESSSTSLERQSQSFDSNIVLELTDINRRLLSAEKLLSEHVVVSPLFTSLQDITLKTVRFTNFSFQNQVGDTKDIIVKMSGVAQSYDAIALQSDMFSKNRFLKDPVFSNLVPDQKGNISFDLTFFVDPSFLLYKTYATQ
jgi:hypothetical protein